MHRLDCSFRELEFSREDRRPHPVILDARWQAGLERNAVTGPGGGMVVGKGDGSGGIGASSGMTSH
jgi:hypothetical protein